MIEVAGRWSSGLNERAAITVGVKSLIPVVNACPGVHNLP